VDPLAELCRVERELLPLWHLVNSVPLRKPHQRFSHPGVWQRHLRMLPQELKLPLILLPGRCRGEEEGLQPFQRSQIFIASMYRRAAQGNKIYLVERVHFFFLFNNVIELYFSCLNFTLFSLTIFGFWELGTCVCCNIWD
jgi:hypothetical protein